MNFIEKALNKKDALSSDEFLQAMADIYKEPHMWENLSEYPRFIQDVIYIIDYDTEVQMEGLEGFFTNSAKEHFYQTCQALQNCGAIREADILEKAEAINWEDEGAEEQYSELEKQIALQNDYEAFWDLVRNYIEQ